MLHVILVCGIVLCLCAVTATFGATALLYAPPAGDFGKVLLHKLGQAGFDLRLADSQTVGDLIKQEPDIVVLSDARQFPVPALPSLLEYLRHGGRLLTVGGPAFEDCLLQHHGEWITATQAKNDATQHPPAKMLFSFKPGGERAWTRSTNHPEYEEKLTVHEDALVSFVSDLNGWNTYGSPVLDHPFPQGDDLTVLEARGDANTPRMSVEWRENDGSRWIADIKLTDRWKRYALAPSDFNYWDDSSVTGRGGPGDHFHPENAHQLWLGLAQTFGTMPRGRHLWWVRDIGVGPDIAAGARISPPILETLSPPYKTYPMHNIRRVQSRPGQALVDPAFALSGKIEGIMPLWRARGLGDVPANPNPIRFIPVADAFDRRSEWRGTAAWFLLNFDGDYQGGIWAGVGVDAQHLSLKQQESVAVLASSMASRMFSGPFFRRAGSSEFAYYPADKATLGAVIVNPLPQEASAQVSVVLIQKGKEQPLAQSGALKIEAGGSVDWDHKGVGLDVSPGPARLVTRLTVDGRTVDEIAQPISILREASSNQPVHFIRVRDGQFVRDGRPMYMNGVNYWPRNAIGMEPGPYTVGWLNPWRYDPELIERDLQTLEAMRVNLVSIQYMNPALGPELADFLERCRHHRIFVNIYLEATDPLHPRPELAQSLIEAAKLANNPEVFAYDLAWEPVLGRFERRAALDPQWRQWIAEQYGSIERAEKDWGCQANRTADGGAGGPTDDQLTHDGPWRRMVAAYRRFADDIISRGYGRVRLFMHQLDPHHLLGVRTGFGGTGQSWPVPAFPYDLASGAAHLDFISPEGYGLQGDLDNYLAAGFTTEYARLVSGGKPVFWAEYGQSIWPDSYDEKALEIQAEHYKKNYALFAQSHANGSAAWWWPGGFRVEENSDFGLIQPDGEPRPAALVIRDQASRLQKSLRLPAASETIPIDRDEHVDGYAGIWAAGRAAYLDALKHHKRAALRTAATGLTSKDAPAVAVGDVAWTGDNPSKYLNAEIFPVEVSSDGAHWEMVEGAPVQMEHGQPVFVRVSLTNSGQVRWLRDAGEEGKVTLGVNSNGRSMPQSLPSDVDTLTTIQLQPFRAVEALQAECEISLRMSCSGRGDFGERAIIRIEPAAR